METVSPHVRTIPVRCAPAKAPCPHCGKLGRRKATHNRRVRTIAYKQVAFLDVTYGEYRARCSCCKTFRTTPPNVEPRALYDNTVRQAVLDRILDDGMSVERAESMYEVINVLKAVAMGQEILPLDPETGEPIGDYDDSQGYSSSQNEDGTGFAYVGEQRIIPEDALERLRAEELALWRQDWDCQNEADIQKLRLQAEQDAVDDLVARFPQLGDSG